MANATLVGAIRPPKRNLHFSVLILGLINGMVGMEGK